MPDSTPPLTPADCDLRAFRDMPLDIGRFRDSDLVTEEEPEAIVAALMLWGTAWHQVPAASVPDNDRWLAKAAGYGRSLDAWLAVRDGALRGFVRCNDGRLYHRVLAEKANGAWDKRLEHEWRKAGDRHRKAFPDKETRPDFPEFDAWKAGRPIVPPAPPRQQNLPLEAPEDFRRNDGGFPPERPSERAPAHTAQARTERARTGAETVPTGVSGGNTQDFQRNGTDFPADLPLKGREGKGRDIDSTQPDSPEPAKPDRLDDRDLQALFQATCEAAGFHPVSPGQINLAYAKVQAWRDAGIDFDEVVVPTIRKTVANSSDPTRTLGRFDKAVRHEAARRSTNASLGKRYVPPASPITCKDQEEPVFALVRQEVLEKIGAQAFALHMNPVLLEPVDMGQGTNRKPVRVIGDAGAAQRLLDSSDAATLRSVLAHHGFNELW